MITLGNEKVYNLLFVILITLAFFCLLFIIADPVFEVNDDMTIIAIYSGQLGFSASNDAVFISSILGTIFQDLYHLNPEVPWYSLTLYLLHFISLAIGVKIIFETYQSLLVRAFCSICFFSLYSLIFYRLSFTSTSLLILFLTMLYILHLNIEGKKTGLNDLLPGFLLVIGFLLRPSIAIIAFTLSSPMLLSFLLPGVKKRLIYAVLPLLLVMFLSLFCSDYIISRQRNDDYYSELQSARSRLTDTIEGLPNNNTGKALAAANWTEADYHLGRLYWSHNEEVYSAEKINQFLSYNSQHFFPASFNLLLYNLFIRINYIVILCSGLFMLVGLKEDDKPLKTMNIIEANYRFIKIIIIISLLAILSGTLFLAAIRFPPRIAMPILIYLFMLIVVLKPVLNKLFYQRKKFLNHNLKVGISSLIIVFFTFVNLSNMVDYSSNFNSKKEFHSSSIKMLQKSHEKDIIFVEVGPDFYLAYASPLKEFQDVAIFDRLPGGWNISTSLYYEVLRGYGASDGREFMEHAINNDKVIFSFREVPNNQYCEYGVLFKKHINDHYGHLYTDSSLSLDILLIREAHENLRWYFFKIITED